MNTVKDIEVIAESKLGLDLPGAIKAHEVNQTQPEIVSLEVFSNGNCIVHYMMGDMQKHFANVQEAVTYLLG